MANYRRRIPRHGATARERSSDWRYPQIEKGNSQRSRAANKRRALSTNDILDDVEYEYDPLDTSQAKPRLKNKIRLTREQRAVRRAATIARHKEWREWYNLHLSWRSKIEDKPKEEGIDLGIQPELIQPKRKRRS